MINLEIKRHWVCKVIGKEELFPHVNECYKGYRILLLGVNLLLESTGLLWESTQLHHGDEIAVLDEGRVITI